MTKRSFSGILLGGFFILATAIKSVTGQKQKKPSQPAMMLPFPSLSPSRTDPLKSAAILFVGGSGKLKLWKGRGPRSKKFPGTVTGPLREAGRPDHHRGCSLGSPPERRQLLARLR